MLDRLSCHIIKNLNLGPEDINSHHCHIHHLFENHSYKANTDIFRQKQNPLGQPLLGRCHCKPPFTYNDNKYEVCNLLVSLFQSPICYL